MTDLTLNDGRTIPAIGFGTYQVPPEDAARLSREALDAGYRLVDTAAFYGNEAGVGEATAGTDAFVTTKLWRDDMGFDATLRAFDASLAKLGRDSVDLFLIHWPMPSHGLYVETWRALVRLRDEKRAISIGVSNFSPDHLDRIVDATGVVPALNQIELHPNFQQRAARAAHERLGIVTQSWSPLGQGRTIADPVIGEIAARTGATPAQVILAWHLQAGLGVIPKASSRARIDENLAAQHITLSAEDIATIDAMDDADGRLGPNPDTL
ncbi:aldo/keto reductase [Sphingomonas sp. CFBP 13720]|uniref:aldo/keto reductase n=1 Tax=Sphingomonas sp. CFBP 13720 TaxID=2775302 RepID=UPI00177F9F80|nr:aldo/keto reductase [Sphingomonas sp. CFBP 13720]MBD8678504.1 aldo/keto reductase [Sphingomonas sp. CFBP 13720]